jgi:hypothetical protein
MPPEAAPPSLETGTETEAPAPQAPKAAWEEVEEIPVAPKSIHVIAPPPSEAVLPAEQQAKALTEAALKDADPNISLERLAQQEKEKISVAPAVKYNEEVIFVEGEGNDTGAKQDRRLQRQPSNFSEMKDDLLDGLKASLNDTINNTVESSVKTAVADLREEMQKRGTQADELSEQMRRLSRTVSNIQAGLAAAGLETEELS